MKACTEFEVDRTIVMFFLFAVNFVIFSLRATILLNLNLNLNLNPLPSYSIIAANTLRDLVTLTFDLLTLVRGHTWRVT